MSSPNKLFKKVFNVNDVKINNVDLYEDIKGISHLKINVSLHKAKTNICPICHKKCKGYDSPSYKRMWRHLDLGGIISEIEMDAKRIECDEHGVLLEEVPFAYKDSSFTKDFDKTAAFFAKSVSSSFVSEYMRVAWKTVGKCVSRVREDLDPDLKRRFNNLVNIGIDETSYKKGHSYITIVVNHDTNEVVWVSKGHNFETISKFFEELSIDQRASIKTITGDGAKWIDKAIEIYVPHVTRCCDGYHIVSWVQDALSDIRKDAWHRAKDNIKNLSASNKKYTKGRPQSSDIERTKLKEAKDYASSIKNSKYALGKNPENLTETQSVKLELIAKNDHQLYKAYTLKESLRMILHTKDVIVASNMLDEWLSLACRSKISQMVELSRKIRRHKQHILNTIATGLSNARIESINNTIKLIIRRAYGFRNLDNMFNMIYLVCSNIQIDLPNRVKKVA